MEVTKIEITNYKSIKEPVTVHFNHDMPTVLIGKNGSGKTNILETLETIASANNSHLGSEENFRYKAHIKLSEQDFVKLFPNDSYEEEKCTLVVCNGEKGLRIDRIQSNYIVPHLQEEIEDIRSLSEKLRTAIEEYKKQLTKISYDDGDNQPIRCFEIYDFKGRTTNYEMLKNSTEWKLKQADDFINTLSAHFSNEEALTFIFTMDIYLPYCSNNFLFKLEFVEPDLASFEQKFISINKTAIKREITKINNITKDSCEKISRYLKEIDERIKHFKNVMEFSGYLGNNENCYQFLGEIQKLIGKKCLFLRNESNNVIFFEREHEQYRQRNQLNPIIETYIKKVQRSENKDISWGETEQKEFENYLNQNLPEFENGMYDKVSVEILKEDEINIFLHEKSGEKINLNKTSAGRRWYFTYYFMKNTLEEGDLFIIDEPAGMLHPLAQKEVLQELLTLEKQGIKVIYSTHSPYLIPKEWGSVHFVSMSERGTKVYAVKEEREVFEQMKEIAGNDVFNLQEIYELYCHSDVVELAHNCYEAVKDNFKTIEKAAAELKLSEDTIKSWRKKESSSKFRSPKLENVFMIAAKTQIDIRELF